MSTISNERLEEIAEEDFGSDVLFESSVLARELLALRKERERAEPVAYPAPQDASPGWKIDPEFINKVQESIGYDEECECWEGTPSMEIVEAVLLAASKLNATHAPVVVDDSLPYDPQIAEYEQMMEAELKAAASTAHKVKSELSQMAEKLLRDTAALSETLSAETDTTAQQFESLAGKTVGGSEGFECTPVADLYELLTKCGECYDYTKSAKVAAAWIKDGYSAQEYVKLDRLQEALLFAASEPCK